MFAEDPPRPPPFERIFAYLSLAFVIVVVSRDILNRAGALPSWTIFSDFITSEDVAAAQAEELADQEKLASLTGKTLPTTVDAPIASEQVDASESTPLISRTPTTKKTTYNWQSITFIIGGFLQLVLRAVLLAYAGIKVSRGDWPAGSLGIPVAFITSWLYATLSPLFRPSLTVPYSIFIIYLINLLSSLAAFYTLGVHAPLESSPFSERVALAIQIFNAILTFVNITIILAMPMELNGEPTVDADGLQPAYDDFVKFGEWLTFTWMSRIIVIGTQRAMEEADVWQLSRLLKSRVLMNKFRSFHRKTLLWRLIAANSKDMVFDCVLTIVSTLLGVAQPYLLTYILRALEPDNEASIESFPLRHTALSLPSSFYSFPDAVFSFAFSTPGNPSVSIFGGTGGVSAEKRQLAYFYALVGFVFSLIKSQSDLQHLYYSRRAAVRIQSELIASIYEKALVRKDITGVIASDAKKGKKGKGDETEDKAVNSADVGKIVSLIATDATKFANVANFLTRMYEIPIYLVGACYLLYSLMGPAAFVGYIAFILVTPMSHLIMKRLFSLQKTLLDVRDKRMREMNQAIQAIKFIKFFAWESRWVGRIMDARKREIRWLVTSKLWNFGLAFIWDVVPLLVSVISFTFYVLVKKGELTVAIAFPALQTFSLLTSSLSLIPMVTQFLLSAYVSLQRIEKYLNEEEVPQAISWKSEARMGTLDPSAHFDDRLGCENASFKWTIPDKEDEEKKKKDATPKQSLLQRLGLKKKTPVPEVAAVDEDEDDKDFEMKDLTIWFKREGINLITGPTGSGKSSLLSAILGEMNLTAGKVYLPKDPSRVDSVTGLREDVSFCTQQPWLQHKSIRDNILFGSAYDEKRYEDVLEACALNTDLDLLEDRDQTEIGEKGVSLSGGQKARVALARAVYARSKTVLLDDVLSAVDSHTAENLINKCLRGPLFAGRTIILVTHHVDLVLHAVSWVVQLEEGSIVAQGTVEDLRAEGLLAGLRQAAGEAEKVTETPVAEDAVAVADEVVKAPAAEKPVRKLVDKEEKAEGRVKLKIYLVYFSAASYVLMSLVVILVILRLLSAMSQQFWIRFWGESYDKSENKPSIQDISLHLPSARDNVLPWLGGYIALEFITALFAVVSQIPSIFSSLRASRKLYDEMLTSVIRAPTRWFDKTPSGRILNRFSKDIDTIDSGLQSYIMYVMETLFSGVIAVGTIVLVAPYSAFPLLFFGSLQWWFTQGYITISRDLRRIESNLRSPIISSFSELVNGISTVRAFGAERLFLNGLFKSLDRTQAASYYYWMANRWLLFRFDALGAGVVLFSTVISINSGVTAGLVGIVVSQARDIVYGFYWTLRFYTEMEQALNSVERIYEYLDVPSEPPAIIEDNRPPAYWPSSSGGISVDNLVLRYAPELEPVLHGVTFDIQPREKVGLVGRTGSGKSTMALALFRFVDPSEGKIIIDGIDITTIGLEDLRSRLTIIPQDAVLFTGTIRENLDPFEEHSDEDCLDALRRVQLRTSASPHSTVVNSRANSRPSSRLGLTDSPDNTEDSAESSTVISSADKSNKTIITLTSQVSEGGSNFSSGQRQLIAMARALLRRSRVVVMDESTASVDFATDLKIQEAIREEFTDSILITIAHRLRTVIDYDRILVLDAGKVVEFDTPSNLIAKEDGIFHSMCVKSGDFEELKESAAKRAADRGGSF